MKVFRGVGGSIGRAAGNDWVLPDPSKFVSSHHAVIEMAGNEYRLRDTSTNGTFLNGAEQPIGNGSSVPLNHGDRILIGEYELAVTLAADAPAYPPAPAANPAPPERMPPVFADGPQFPDYAAQPTTHPAYPPPQPPAWPSQSYPPASDPGAAGAWIPGGTEGPADPLEAMENRGSGRTEPPGGAPWRAHQAWPDAGPLSDHYPPPQAQVPQPPGGGPIPLDYDPSKTTFEPVQTGPAAPPVGFPGYPPQPQRAPPARGDSGTWQGPPPGAPAPYPASAMTESRPPPAAAAGAGDGAALRRLLEMAGLDPAAAQAASANPHLADSLGQVLNIVLEGLIEVLRARSDIKDTFRLQHTRMRPHENNPLKFCPDNRTALLKLFLEQGSGFLTPVDAFQESFDDIKAHQMAMMAGMKAAFESLMQRFDPDTLEAEFNRDKSGGMFKPLNKVKYWDNLVELYARQMKNPDEAFRRLFGDAFAEAYEQQMQRLTAMRRRR